jgi:hypothetical protein
VLGAGNRLIVEGARIIPGLGYLGIFVELRCSSRLLGGSLHLKSSQGHGSTFMVKIPEL